MLVMVYRLVFADGSTGNWMTDPEKALELAKKWGATHIDMDEVYVELD